MNKPYKHYRNNLNQRYCTLRYLKARKMLTIIWKGTATNESIRKVEKGVKEMVRKFPCRSIINDVQDFFQAPSAYLRWSEWDMKSLVAAGISCIAYVLPADAPMPETVEGSSMTPDIKFFRQTMDAVEWLNKQNLL